MWTPARTVTMALPVLIGALLIGCASVFGIDDLPPLPNSPDGSSVGDADGSTDGSSDVGPRHCDTIQPKPLFCADFDGPDLFEGFYNSGRVPNPGEVGGGSIRADSVQFVSAPRSVRFEVPAIIAGGVGGGAFLVAELPPVEAAMQIAVDLRIDTEQFTDDKGRVVLLELDFGPTVGGITIARAATGTSLRVVDGATKSLAKVDFDADLAVGDWKTLTLAVHNFPNGAGDSGLEGDVVVALGRPVAKLPLPVGMQQVLSGLRLNVGPIASIGPMGTFRMSVDNVRVDTGL